MGPIAAVRKPLPLPLPPLPCESNTKVSKFDRNSISYCFDRGVVHVVPRANISSDHCDVNALVIK